MILVTGAAGTIGSELVRGLLARGFLVRALLLPNDPFASRLSALGCERFEADITRPDSLKGAFEGVDTVYHLAAVVLARDPAVFEQVNVGGTRHVAEAAAASGVGHFIHVSSASVVYPRTTPYSRSKRACERIVQAAFPGRFTLVRPTLVYADQGGQEFDLFLAALKRFPIVPFIGRGRARKRPVHVRDLTEGLVAIAGNRRTYGKTYNLSGGEAVSMRELARLMLAREGMAKPFLPLPVALCRAFAWGLERLSSNPPLTTSSVAGVTQDADLDPSEAMADLGYRPIGVREGLEARRAHPTAAV